MCICLSRLLTSMRRSSCNTTTASYASCCHLRVLKLTQRRPCCGILTSACWTMWGSWLGGATGGIPLGPVQRQRSSWPARLGNRLVRSFCGSLNSGWKVFEAWYDCAIWNWFWYWLHQGIEISSVAVDFAKLQTDNCFFITAWGHERSFLTLWWSMFLNVPFLQSFFSSYIWFCAPYRVYFEKIHWVLAVGSQAFFGEFILLNLWLRQ